METNQNNIAGSAVFWTLGEDTDYGKLSIALTNAGFSKFTPERMTDYAALKLTLETAYPKHEVFAIGNSSKAMEVVRVQKDSADKNAYIHVLTATVNEWSKVVTDSTNSAVDVNLSESFAANRSKVPYHSLSRCLVSIVYALNGTTLRPSGGIYWIPNASFERWERIAQGIETSGLRNKVFALRTFLDEHSAAVLREALTMEIAREAKEIDETLHDKETSLKLASSTKRRANALRSKIESYESEFSMALTDLKKALDDATTQEAKATLMDVAATIAQSVAVTAGTFTAGGLFNW